MLFLRRHCGLTALQYCVLLLLPAPLCADGISNRQTQSSDYVRTFTRHAATDSLDGVVFNPAGLMQFDDGIYSQLDSVVIVKQYSNAVPGYGTLEDSNAIGVIPALFSLYRWHEWGLYFAFTVPGGGGIVDYAQGNASSVAIANGIMAATPLNKVEDMRVEASSVYFGYTLGGAYAINDTVSVAAGLRQVDANIAAESHLVLSLGGMALQSFDLDFEQHASGLGGFMGVNITPSDAVNIGLVYQSNTRLIFDKDIHRDDVGVVEKFAKNREDLPGLIGIGIGFLPRPDVRLEVDLTSYLEHDATWEGRLQGQGGSYDLSASATYLISPNLQGNIGVRKTSMGINPDKMGAESPELDSVTVAVGGVYQVAKTWTVSFGTAQVFYESAVTSQNVVYDKEAVAFTLGIQKQF